MDFPLSVTAVLLAYLIVTIGSAIQGALGIGLGFFAVPLLALITPAFVPGPLLLAALLLTVLVSVREQHAIDFTGIKWAISGRLVGTAVGLILLIVISSGKLSVLFGIMVLVAVTLSTFGLRVPLTPVSLVGAGTLSGIMGTTAAIGGVPLALVYQDYEGSRLRGTLSGIFVLGTIISLISLFAIGKFQLLELKLAVSLLPGILSGYYLSNKLARVADRGYIRPAVLIVATLSGLFIIIKTI